LSKKKQAKDKRNNLYFKQKKQLKNDKNSAKNTLLKKIVKL
jgi:hypothetical protein